MTINGDRRSEPDETFAVYLGNPSGAVLGRSVGNAMIFDDDQSSLPSASIGDVKVVEGNAGQSVAVFDVTLDRPNSTTVTVHYATAPGTVPQAPTTPPLGHPELPARNDDEDALVARQRRYDGRRQ